MTTALIIYGALMVVGAGIVLAVGWQELRRERRISPIKSKATDGAAEVRGEKGGAEDTSL